MSSVTSITGDGAETIGKPAIWPIQSICRWPCIRMARPDKGLRLRTNQLPLMSAVPMRSDSALAAQGYSMT